jgi:hypothetical protein
MSEWRPIETAPRDGTEILGYFSGYSKYRIVHWNGWGGGCWSDGVIGKWMPDEMKAWRPLPESPEDT